MPRLPFTEFVDKVIHETRPLSQNTSDRNLGFGWLYYGLVRNLDPHFVIAIGSCAGFMPFCAARGLQDNGRGQVIFIDPSFRGEGDPGWSGLGLWDNPDVVNRRIQDFQLDGWITHLKLTSEEALPTVKELLGSARAGLVVIDGAHTHENSLQDFELYSSLISRGFVVFHDATNTACGVSRTLQTLRSRRYPVVTLHKDAGLAIVEIGSIPSVESHWDYLCQPSNRAGLILPTIKEIIRPRDRILDIYCGSSPMGYLLQDVEIVGWDRDLSSICKLRKDLPQHRWEQIDELALPFASALPSEVDVILGLGLVKPRANWDAQCAVDIVRYLLGRYAPRVVLFESAADYYSADILDDIAVCLKRLAYSITFKMIDTDMASYARRKLLVGQRS